MAGNELCFNRQINFYIMRHMWQVIHGRNANDRIYECFGMSRQRYSNAIKSGKIRCSNDEAKKLEQLTGVSRKVFQGIERIECYGTKSNGPAISQEEWVKLFAWRNGEQINGERIDGDTGKALQKAIHKKLEDADRTNTNTYHFFRLCYFLKENRPAPLHGADEQMRIIRHALSTLSFELAKSCDTKQLKATIDLLRQKLKMANGIMTYREEESKAKKQ